MYNPDEIRELRFRVRQLEKELEEERIAHAKTSGLLMSGESLRQQLMVKAILAGAFNPPIPEVQA